MPDIAKCSGENCPHKKGCYRFTSEPSEYHQSYFMEPPIKDNRCDHYWGKNGEKIWNDPIDTPTDSE